MATKLIIKREDEGQDSHIFIGGVIDEAADFGDCFKDLNPNIMINFDGVEMINSCGVREWIQALRKIPEERVIHYEKCPPRIVEQINYISNFLGNGVITSFYAPYYCPKEKKDVNILLTPKDIKRSENPEAPKRKCPDCRTHLEFEDVEDEYFSFLNNT